MKMISIKADDDDDTPPPALPPANPPPTTTTSTPYYHDYTYRMICSYVCKRFVDIGSLSSRQTW